MNNIIEPFGENMCRYAVRARRRLEGVRSIGFVFVDVESAWNRP